jgi:XXXCH domain-containing protein
MSSRKHKVEFEIPLPEAVSVLGAVGRGLQRGQLELAGGTIQLEEFRSLELTLHPRGETLHCKLKVKYPQEVEAPQEETEYRSLKKRMQRSWKLIRRCLGAGSLPEQQLLESFLADSRRMVTYPGKGEARYPDYLAAVESLQTAVAAESLEATLEAYARVEEQRRRCH